MKILIPIIILLVTNPVVSQIYVDASKTSGSNNGTNWVNAYTDLQTALTAASSGQQIWVAAGTYKPTSGTDRTISFQMKNGVSIFGGFDGLDDTQLSDRNLTTNITVLSGDIGTAGNSTDNSYHVIYNPSSASINNSAVLEGFVISGGNANGVDTYTRGGGIFNEVASPILVNCTFIANYANDGGGIYNYNSSPLIFNCVFNSNSAINGGGIHAIGFGSAPIMTHCTIFGNTATIGSAVTTNDFCNIVIRNSIVWGEILPNDATPVITYSCILGGWGGAGNISSDPKFVDSDGTDNIAGTLDDNLRIKNSSSCIGAGSSAYASATDVLGLSRGNPPDMGAYENSLNTPQLDIIYVNDNAAGSNTGLNWTDAYTSLSTAVFVASSGDKIWVASGTYKPASGRASSFQMKNGVEIYGGFNGIDDDNINDRNPAVNLTILSGDIGIEGNNSDNNYHVIFNGPGLNNTALIDGFIITGGNANSSSPNNVGGGMYNEDSYPTVRNCKFVSNSAASGGGLFESSASSTRIINCLFYGNSASNQGGGIYFYTGSPVITNCAFSGNSASATGGGIYFHNSSPVITNCTFSGNSAITDGGGLFNYSTNPVVKNTIFWGSNNQTSGGTTSNFTYCCIQNGSGVYTGTGNFFNKPHFVDADGADNIAGNIDDDLRLMDKSVCIGAGIAAAEAATDVLGLTRGTPPDIGAYENSRDVPLPPITIYVNDDAGGSDDGTTWLNAYLSLQTALDDTRPGDQIWVAAGTYKPTQQAGGTGERFRTFRMKNNIAIYGGFNGVDDDDISDRNFSSNETILSGDIGVQGNNADNCIHVIYNPTGLTNTAIVDGFTITGGNANESSPHDCGGGIYNMNTAPSISNCTFLNNSSVNLGGGIFLWTFSYSITNCKFLGNSANKGGGIFIDNAMSLINCIFSGNLAAEGGGAYSYHGTSIITNCTFSNNSASANGGGLRIEVDCPIIKNTIFWDNNTQIYGGFTSNFTYCCIQGGSGSYTGAGNIFTNPLFVDADGADNIMGTNDDNLQLENLSPSIGAGTSTGAPATDILGITRNTQPDIGAYENTSLPRQARSISFSNICSNQITINWINGNKEKRVVFVKQANSGTASPVDNTTYTPATILGNGTQIGSTGWYCIYNGTGSSVIVTGLSLSTDYIVQVFEYSGASGVEIYVTSTASDNPKSKTTPALTNYALSFSGGSNQAAYRNIFDSNLNDQTLEAWVKWNGNTSAAQIIVSNGNAGSDGYGLYLYNDNKIGLLMCAKAWYLSNELLSTGIWTHLALVKSGNLWTIYKNGISIYSVTIQPGDIIVPSTNFHVGGLATGDYIFNGIIDEVRFSNAVRYTTNFTPAETFTTDASTISLYHFNEGTDLTAADVSGHGYNLSLINNPQWVIVDNPLPVELVSFNASVESNIVQLNWSTVTEVNCYGFEVERKVPLNLSEGETSENPLSRGVPEGWGVWEEVGFVKGNGYCNSIKEYSYADDLLNLNPNLNHTLLYRLKLIDNDGTYKYSDEVEVDIKMIPAEFVLEQNYPNPFNPTTKIKYSIPSVETNSSASVQIKIYDVLGNELTTLVNEEKKPGYYIIQWNANHLASGVYFCTMQAGEFKAVKKMMLVK